MLHRLSIFLFGAEATRLQVVASLGTAAVAMLAVAALTGLQVWSDWVLLPPAFDIFGGIVSNAAASTRRVHAAAGAVARRRFFLVHAAEMPVIWWLAGGGAAFWLLAAGMAAKLSVYALGSEDPVSARVGE